MRRRAGMIVVGVVVGLLLGVFLYPALAQRVAAYSKKAAGKPAVLATRGSEVLDCWPVSRSWSWTVNPVTSKPRVAIVVRTVETEIHGGNTPTFPAIPKLFAKGMGTDRRSGWLADHNKQWEGKWPEGKVVCQVIDFREVGLDEAAVKQPLRLLVWLRIGGNLLSISRDNSILQGETLAGSGEVEPRWVDDELHLLTIQTATEKKLYTHHVLIEQSDLD